MVTARTDGHTDTHSRPIESSLPCSWLHNGCCPVQIITSLPLRPRAGVHVRYNCHVDVYVICLLEVCWNPTSPQAYKSYIVETWLASTRFQHHKPYTDFSVSMHLGYHSAQRQVVSPTLASLRGWSLSKLKEIEMSCL